MGKAVDHMQEIVTIVNDNAGEVLSDDVASRLIEHANKLHKKIPKKPKNPNAKQRAAMAFDAFEESYNMLMDMHRKGVIEHNTMDASTCVICRLYDMHSFMRDVLIQMEDKGEIKAGKPPKLEGWIDL